MILILRCNTVWVGGIQRAPLKLLVWVPIPVWSYRRLVKRNWRSVQAWSRKFRFGEGGRKCLY